MPSVQMPATHPVNNFDALRLVGAFSVLASHQFALTGHGEPMPGGLYSLGSLGVALFFTISGFLVARSWQSDPNVWRFALRRLLRIWPGFAVAIVAAAMLLGPAMTHLPLHDYFQDRQVRHYFKNLYFDLQDALPLRFEGNALPSPLNGSLWTIPIELKCYVALAVAGMVGLLRARYLVPMAWVAIVVVYAGLEPRGVSIAQALGWDFWKWITFEYALLFTAGACYHLLNLGTDDRRWKATAVSLMVGVIAWACSRQFLGFVIAMPVTLLSVGLASWPLMRSAGRWGDISFGVYIYAFPVQQTLIWLAKGRVHWALLAAACVAVTVVLALLSWHLIEKRALHLKPRGLKRPSAPAVALPGAAGTTA